MGDTGDTGSIKAFRDIYGRKKSTPRDIKITFNTTNGREHYNAHNIYKLLKVLDFFCRPVFRIRLFLANLSNNYYVQSNAYMCIISEINNLSLCPLLSLKVYLIVRRWVWWRWGKFQVDYSRRRDARRHS